MFKKKSISRELSFVCGGKEICFQKQWTLRSLLYKKSRELFVQIILFHSFIKKFFILDILCQL